MNRFLKVLAGIIIGLFLLMLVLPIIFKGKIEKIVKEEINNQVNADVDYSDFSLSLIKSFPNINMGIEGLSVVGKGVFSQDTLVHLGRFATQIDLYSAIKGQVEVKSVLLKDLSINAIVLKDSSANWDITKGGKEVAVQEEVNSDKSDFKVVLESFVIDNANIKYDDQTMNLKSAIQGFQMTLSGDMSETITNLQLASSINKFFVLYDDIKYINGAALSLKAGIGADLENMIFNFMENEIEINRLAMKIDGQIALKDNGYGIDLQLGTTNTDFKSLLALVPEVYMKDFDGLKTEGIMHLNMVAKGDYIDEDNLPAFDLNLLVENGMIQYPELPESIDNINIQLKVNNEGGALDKTITNLEQFHFELANNPFDASLKVSTPISNPVFKGLVDGQIDLGSLVKAIPLDSFDIKGLIEANFSIDGEYAMVEREDYESIDAHGNISLTNFAFVSQDLPQGMQISNAILDFNPKTISLETFNFMIGASDFQLNGKLENYLAYALKDGVLRGQINHNSTFINSNEFFEYSGEETPESDSDEEEMALVEVPKNLNLKLNSSVEKLLYDKLNIYKVKGKLLIRDGFLKMDGLKMQLLDGNMHMNGQYNTSNMNKPYVDFKIEGADLDLNMAANSFSVVDSMLPLAKNTVGRVSPKISYYSQLNKEATPILSTADGGGWIRSKSVEVSGSKIQNSLASTLKNESYKTMKAEDLNINFIIDQGNIIVKPFKTKVGGKLVEVEGTQGLDQSINYKITMPVSRKEVAKMAGLMGFNLPTSGDDLMVDMLVTGTVQEPKLGFDLEKAQKQVAKDLEKEGKNLLKNLLKGF